MSGLELDPIDLHLAGRRPSPDRRPRSTAALLHQSAETYAATDHTNAAGIRKYSPSANSPTAVPPLNL